MEHMPIVLAILAATFAITVSPVLSQVVSQVAPDIGVWPLPTFASVSGEPISLPSNFKIESNSSSSRLAAAIKRYRLWIVPAGRQNGDQEQNDMTGDLAGLMITVASGDETLTYQTSYAYKLNVANASGGPYSAGIEADTVYGAIYGLETFSQFVMPGGILNYSSIVVVDTPTFNHRGLMIDTGRRFFPVSMVETLLDAMSYMKLNVLHFHLSDLCRFSVQSLLYPQLTAESDGFYTQQEIINLVAYAMDRGVRVVPEFDIPGHSHGFLPLAKSGDVTFCTGGETQLRLDGENHTVTTLDRLFLEMSTLFEDELFHLGCDETRTSAACPLASTAALERDILKRVEAFGRTPAGWEEVLFGSGAATNVTVIYGWKQDTASQITARGYRAVESNGGRFYLNHAATPYTGMWTDISAGMPAASRHLLLGGEVSMWSDNYCYVRECTTPSIKPIGHWMYDRSEDKAFEASVTAMIWPRAIVAAGSFWNYDASLDATSPAFLAHYDRQTRRLLVRGIASCPVGCKCDEVSKCGVPYPHTNWGPYHAV